MTEQLRKHKEHLRSQYRFPRVRGEERQRIEPQARFEDTVAAVKPEKVSSFDVAGFVNANLERLRRYVERELRFRRDSGQRRRQEISTEEVSTRPSRTRSMSITRVRRRLRWSLGSPAVALGDGPAGKSA